MRLNEFKYPITEIIGDSKIPYKWVKLDSNNAEAIFTVGDFTYHFYAEVIDEVDTDWEISFTEEFEGDETTQKTGTGNSSFVISTVFNLISDFTQKYNVDIIMYITDDPHRKKLYKHAFNRILPRWEILESDFSAFVYKNTPEIYNRVSYYEEKCNDFQKAEGLTEAPLVGYDFIGNMDKPGRFSKVDRKLLSHPITKLKAIKFFEKTPYNFRVFLNNSVKTDRTGKLDIAQVFEIFGDKIGEEIITGQSGTITIIFSGNTGAEKVMLTPWMMAHRLGHALQYSPGRLIMAYDWKPIVEDFFVASIKRILGFYGYPGHIETRGDVFDPKFRHFYNALGTQKSSRNNAITRPYEFIYELFAQYLGTGKITLNPLPETFKVGREWRRTRETEESRKNISEIFASDMGQMFDDLLSACVGNVYII